MYDYIYNVAAIVLVLIPTCAAIYLAAKALVLAFRGGADVWAAGRNLAKEIRGLVDQTSDPLVMAIAARTGKTPGQVMKELTGLIDPIINMLPEGNADA